MKPLLVMPDTLPEPSTVKCPEADLGPLYSPSEPAGQDERLEIWIQSMDPKLHIVNVPGVWVILDGDHVVGLPKKTKNEPVPSQVQQGCKRSTTQPSFLGPTYSHLGRTQRREL